MELHPKRSRAPPRLQPPRLGAPKPTRVPSPGHPSRATWSASTRRQISTSSPEAPGNGFEGGTRPVAHREPTSGGNPPDRRAYVRSGQKTGVDSVHSPFLGAFLLPSPHLTVLSAEKGNFSITAVKLISYLHWMDLL